MKRLGAATLACGIVLALATVASAHEGDGRLEVLGATPGDAMAVDYQVRLTYVADGHGAPEATVTAVAEQPGRPATVPVQLRAGAEEGTYSGTVTFPSPGNWTVRFTSVTPAAALERPEAVAAPAATTTSSPSSTTTEVARAPGADEQAAEVEDDEGSGFPVVLVVAGLVIAVAAAAAWALTARRRSAPA